MNDKTDNRKHRPPKSAYMIDELIKMGKYDDAQKWCDENEEFYQRKIQDTQDLFMKAQRGKLGYTEDKR